MTDASSRLRRLLLGTTVMTYSLILLGIYTAAVGAGLTCDARWPLCDGAVFGLFPANWPSFVEWFHRLIAMIVGFMILGSAYGALRWNADRRLKGFLAIAVVLLPVQIWLGAETVLTYEVIALIAHFLTAVVIFTALLFATIRTFNDRLTHRQLRLVGYSVLVLLPLLVVVSPTIVAVHDGTYQVAYNGIGLAIFSLLVAGATWAWVARTGSSTFAPAAAALLGGAAIIVLAQMTIGRVASVLGLPAYTGIGDVLVFPGTVFAFLLTMLGIWCTARMEPVGPSAGTQPTSE